MLINNERAKMSKKTIIFKSGIIDINKLDNGTENIIIELVDESKPKYDEIVLENFLIQDWRKDKINGEKITSSNNK